jgi:hypothetical protein
MELWWATHGGQLMAGNYTAHRNPEHDAVMIGKSDGCEVPAEGCGQGLERIRGGFPVVHWGSGAVNLQGARSPWATRTTLTPSSCTVIMTVWFGVSFINLGCGYDL